MSRDFDGEIEALQQKHDALYVEMVSIKGEIMRVEAERYAASPEAIRFRYLEALSTAELQALCLAANDWQAANVLVRRAYADPADLLLRGWIEREFNRMPYWGQLGIRRALRTMGILRSTEG